MTRAMVALLALAPSVALAGSAFVTQQGRLLDGAGAPINGAHTLRVSLYADLAGTAGLWQTTYASVPVSDGYYSVALSGLDDTARSLDGVVGTSPLYVGVAVDGAVDMLPLERLGESLTGGGLPTGCAVGSVPYMGVSGWVCTAGGTTLQEVSTTATTTTTAAWPAGAYVNTAGTQIMSVTITPTVAGSTLDVIAVGAIRENGNNSNLTGMGIFRDAQVNALAVAHNSGTYSPYSHGSAAGGQSHIETLTWTGASGGASPVTIKVRIGADAPGIACSPGLCSLVVRERL